MARHSREEKDERQTRARHGVSDGGARVGRPSPADHDARPVGHDARPAGRSAQRSFGSGRVAGSGGDQLLRVRKSRARRRSRTGVVVKAVAVALAVVVVAVAVSGALLYRSMQGLQADAQSLLSLAADLQADVESGDLSGLPEDAQRISEVVSGMKSEIDGPLWVVASALPVVGGDVSAARQLVTAIDSAVSDGLVPVSQDLAGVSLDTIFGDGGSIDVPAVQTVVDSLASIAPAVSEANAAVQSIGSTSISQVTSLVDQAKSAFSMLDEGLQTANDIAPYLPQMLGADGQSRTYLILAMNNVEIRASGGFPGAQALLTVTDGQLELGDFRSLKWLPDDVELPISEEEHRLYDIDGATTLGRTIGDSTMTPDFPRVAELVIEEWEILYGEVAEGVIAVDPVFLQYLLELVGGVTLEDGTVVDGTNAARVLMSDTYWNFSTNDEMDAFFASAAGTAFGHILDSIGSVSLSGLAETVGRSVEEGRVLMWSSVEEEEQALETAGVAGALPDDPSDPVAGIYVNNFSYSKLDWYLTLDTSVSDGIVHDDGTTTYRVTVSLTNTLTDELAEALPTYAGATSSLAYEKGDEMLRLYLYAPAGGTVSNVDVADGGSGLVLEEAEHDGLQVFFGLAHLLPGQTCTVTYSVTTPAEAAGETLKLRVTPTAQDVRDAAAESDAAAEADTAANADTAAS